MWGPEWDALRLRLLAVSGALVGIIYLALLALGGRTGLESTLSQQQFLCLLMGFIMLVAVAMARW